MINTMQQNQSLFYSVHSSSLSGAYITNNATQPLTGLSEICVCYASSS